MQQPRLRPRAALAGTALLAGALIAAPAMAKTQTQHLRGTISSVSDHGFMMKTESGKSRKVTLGSDTGIAGVTSSSLGQIQKGTFIGTANVKKNGSNQALEMVIFPPSMKGTGLGNYSWDLSPSEVNSQGSKSSNMSSGSSMTNGTVSASSSDSMKSGSSMTNGTVSSKNSGSMSSGSSMTNGTVSSTGSGSMQSGSSMTNGTVTQSSGSQSMTLKVDYGKGSKTIHVPANVPVVKVQKASKSDLKKGAHVFVMGPQGSQPFKASKVIVGINGAVPPM